MPKSCEHNIPETLKGTGPCDIGWEVKKRNGKPNWWCKTHGLDASAPDGAALEACPGSWFDPVPVERQIELDVADGEVGVWGALAPALTIGAHEPGSGGVHVHRRRSVGEPKDVDDSFDIVRLKGPAGELVVETMAAVAFSVSQLAGRETKVLRCPKPACGALHIDELKFATHPHVKHLCNRCGRNFRDASPSISNPLADAHKTLGIAPAPDPVAVERPLELRAAEFGAIALWPSNKAIVSSTGAPEDAGIHVHAWDPSGEQVIDETFFPVMLDGEVLDLDEVRVLALQRALAHGAPIANVPCSTCGTALLSSTADWIEPSTKHACQSCGALTITRRRSFLNPLADK